MKILSKPKGNAEEYGKWSVNPYVGCPHRCLYCYLKKGVWANNLGGNSYQLKKGILNSKHALYLAMAEILDNRDQIIKDGSVFMTFTSDPLLYAAPAFLFNDIASECSKFAIPVTMLTKVGTRRFFRGDLDSINVFYGGIKKLAIGWTLTGHDELEPCADRNDDRIALMQEFHQRCSSYYTKLWASIEPVIDFNASYDMIVKALDAGCQHFKIGLLTSNTHVVRKDFQFGEHHFDAYNHDECVKFIHDVMRKVEADGGKATVYWKNSFRDFLGEEDFARATVGYKNIVDKDWNMFKEEK